MTTVGTPSPNPDEVIQMYVSEGHGEYPLPSPIVSHVVWGPPEEVFAGDTVLPPEDMARMFREQTGEDPPPDADLMWESIVFFIATRADVEASLTALLVDVLAGPMGGDDDTFDYWPSGVRLARAVAERLGGTWPNREWPAIVDRAARAAIMDTRAEFSVELLSKVGLDGPAVRFAGSVICYEARCGRCGETFNPASADTEDLEHIEKADGTECGGMGEMTGEVRA